MALPSDGHVHSEWSWDAALGAMAATCARAVDVGLPSIAFTEHADFRPWTVPPEVVPTLPEHFRICLRPDGQLMPPGLDVQGYLACVQECRDRFRSLRVLSGLELSEPHQHHEQVRALLRTGTFERVLGSVHTMVDNGDSLFVGFLMGHRNPADVVRTYLTEITRLAESTSPFAVLAHIDFPARYWPESAGPYRPADFEGEFRTALTALAGSGRALEVNTRVPLHSEVVRWFHQAGGDAISFGSDAHVPDQVGHGLAEAAAMVEACGFVPSDRPDDLWRRARIS
jgi:histidinol-phosphatase (PHP family)